MKTIFPTALFLTGLFLFTGCSSDMSNANTSNTTNRINTSGKPSTTMTPMAQMGNTNKPAMGDDVDFLATASTSGMNEIELSKLAQTRATDSEVKKFAAMMVADHTKAGEEINALGKKKDVKPATEMDSSHKAIMENLKGLSGAEFDREYVDAMVDDHEDAVELFKDQAQNGKDPEIKALAAKILPKLEEHLKMINGISGKIK